MFKLTKEEKHWILYDVGNSAFILLVSTILPIYFNYLASNEGVSEVNYLAYWGYATSFTTIIVAFIGPVLGAIADTKGFKKPIFLTFILVGVIGCAALGFAPGWLIFLAIFIIARVGFSGSLIFYDSMLGDITKAERMDSVSALGYAWGYLGSCIPFILGLVVVLGNEVIGISMEMAMVIALLIAALWWGIMSIPLLKNYKQIHYVEHQTDAIKKGFIRIGKTFKNAKKHKKVFLFLIAYFFYIDGVYTIIDMATAYGTALGLDTTGLLLALLVTQLVAFPFALLFGRLSRMFQTEKLIFICILAYTGIGIFATFMTSQWQFWVLAVCVGMFQGGIQALSRSYYMKIIPKEQSGEFFGLLDICGKGASFLGTTLVAITSQITGSINKGVGVIALLFVVGIFLFIKASKMPE